MARQTDRQTDKQAEADACEHTEYYRQQFLKRVASRGVSRDRLARRQRQVDEVSLLLDQVARVSSCPAGRRPAFVVGLVQQQPLPSFEHCAHHAARQIA